MVVGIVFDVYGLSDQGLNDSADAGLIRAQKEFGFHGIMVDSKAETDYQPNLEALATRGANVVVAVGSSMVKPIEAAAKEFPKVKFIIVDSRASGPNIESLLFKQEEAGYVAGYLGSLMTSTKTLGFVGGKDTPEVRSVLRSFTAGALAGNPSAKVLPPKFTDSWLLPELARLASNDLYDAGADVIFPDARRAGLGVLMSAVRNKKFAISSDVDLDDSGRGYVLASIVKRCDNAVYAALKDAVAGNFKPGDTEFDFKHEGFSLSAMTRTSSVIGSDKLRKVDQVVQDLKRGNLQLPVK